MGKLILAVLAILVLVVGGYFLFNKNAPEQAPITDMPQEINYELKIESPAFAHMGIIPSRYACDGEKMSPPLAISGVSPEARSLVLIMEDPDVPKSVRSDGMWDHWIRFNLPSDLTEIKENTDPGGVAGMTTSKHTGYVPPCPPDREHRYFFKLYSLDFLLNLSQGATKSAVLAAMQGHILQQTELIGLYEKK